MSDGNEKYLAYFFLSGEAKNAAFCARCVETMRARASVSVDVVVLCSEEYAPHAQQLPNVKVVTTPSNARPIDAAKRKLQLFELFPEAAAYTCIVNLEPASIFCGDVARLFNACTSPSKLYVFTEPGRDNLNYVAYGLLGFTEQDKMYCTFNNIYGFNTRQFVFRPSEQMREQFAKVLELIAAHDESTPFFCEQSFMNHHFIKQKAKHLDRLTLIRYVYYINQGTAYEHGDPIVVACQGYNVPIDTKQRLLDGYYAQAQAAVPVPATEANKKDKPIEVIMFRSDASLAPTRLEAPINTQTI